MKTLEFTRASYSLAFNYGAPTRSIDGDTKKIKGLKRSTNVHMTAIVVVNIIPNEH